MKKLFIILLSLVSLAGYSQVVNVGTTANDGTGDSFRTAFQKINAQFGADSLQWRQDIADSIAQAQFNAADTTSLSNRIDLKAPLASPTFTGVVTVPSPSNATDAATKGYVDGQVTLGTVWKDPVEDIVSTLASGITINLRYILSTDGHIYTSDGDNTWTDLGATDQGTAVYVKADGAVPTNNVGPYNYNGSSWVSIGTGSNHNDLTAIQGGASNDYYHLTSAQRTVATQAATSSVNGYLSSTDWSTFNGKLSPTGSANALTNFPTLNQNTTGSAASLLNSRTIYGNAFDGTQSLTQTIGSTFGGTGNAYFLVSGPATSIKTFTFPNVNATIARTDAAQSFTGYQTFSDRVYFDTYNYLLGGGSSSVSLVSTFTNSTQMDFQLGNTSAGLNFGGLNGGLYWDVNKVTIRAASSDIIWDGTRFRTAIDSVPYASAMRTADNLRLLKSDSSSTLGGKYATGKMLADGLATKQATLVNTTNIKSINGASILGSGNLTVTGTGVTSQATYDSIRHASLGIWNIMDYGATDGDLTPDQAAIQAAINAASVGAVQSGGTVRIPAGYYYLTGPDTLKSYVNIDCDPEAFFLVPDSYTGSVWYSGLLLEHCTVTGGKYYGPTATWTGIKLVSPGTANYNMANRFRDMYFSNVGTGIDLSTTSNGWINSNNFEDFWISGPIRGIKTRQGAGSLGLDGNNFMNITIQTSVATLFGIDSLTGAHNKFTNLMIWDFNVTDPSAKSCVLSAGSQYTEMIGTSIDNQNYSDKGISNYVISDGRLLPYKTALTSGAGNNLIIFDLATGGTIGGNIHYLITVTNAAGTEVQSQSGTVYYSAVRVSTNYVSSVVAGTDVSYAEYGGSFTHTTAWSAYCADALFAPRLTFTTNIASPTIYVYFWTDNVTPIVSQ